MRFLGDAQTETWSALTRALQERHFGVTGASSEEGFPPERRTPTMVCPNHAVAPRRGTLSISVSGRAPRPEERTGEREIQIRSSKTQTAECLTTFDQL